MKAIIYQRYGDPEVLELATIPEPIPKDTEVLIKIHTTTVTAGDCELRGFTLPFSIWWVPVRLYMGVFRPRFKILGQELAGEIVATGKNVKKFSVGDRVFAATTMNLGAHAEFISLSERGAISLIPQGVSYQQAATIATGGLNGIHFVKKAEIQKGERVLIVGAGGSIGTYALQLAKRLGAIVTCIDSGEKLDMLRSIGADHTIDFKQQDFTKMGVSYDAIIEIAGKSSYSRCLKCLKPKGRLIIGNPQLTWLIAGLLVHAFSGKKVVNALASYQNEDMDQIKNLISEGKLHPVIDRVFRLEQMKEAHRYVEEGRKQGNLVIEVDTGIES